MSEELRPKTYRKEFSHIGPSLSSPEPEPTPPSQSFHQATDISPPTSEFETLNALVPVPGSNTGRRPGHVKSWVVELKRSGDNGGIDHPSPSHVD